MHNLTSFCDGLARRDLLRIGVAGLFGSGLPLADLLARQARAADDAQSPDRDVSLIILFLKGGLSTIDTWDLKPEAPAEFRGIFQPIDTNIPGIRIGEHLPLCARHADKFSLVRSFGHRNSDHGPADHYMLTGYHPLADSIRHRFSNQRPARRSVVARKLGPRIGSIPMSACRERISRSGVPRHQCAIVESIPNSPNFSVPDLTPPLAIGRTGSQPARVARKSTLQEVGRNGRKQALSR